MDSGWDEANELVGPLPILGGQVGGRVYRAGLAYLITPGWVVLDKPLPFRSPVPEGEPSADIYQLPNAKLQ